MRVHTDRKNRIDLMAVARNMARDIRQEGGGGYYNGISLALS